MLKVLTRRLEGELEDLKENPDQPAEPGGSNFIVAKDNGEIGTVPNYPPELAIEAFRRG